MSLLFNLSLEKLKKYEPFLFTILVFVLLFPIWINKYFITQDTPSHLYNAKIFLDYVTSHNTDMYDEFYRSNFIAFPYWFSHIFLAFMLWLFPAFIAEKLVLSIYIILFALFTRKTIKYINKDSVFLSYLILLFACSYGFQWGFISFIYGFIFFCGLIFYWLKHQSDFKIKHSIILMLLFTLLYFTHIVFWIFAVITGFTLLIFSIFSKTKNSKTFIYEIKKTLHIVFSILACIIPSIVLYLTYSKYRGSLDAKFYTQEYIVNNFLMLKTLVLVSANESRYAIYVGIVILFFTIYCLLKKLKIKNITIYDGFYLLAFIALIINIYASINMVGFLERLQFLPLLFLILWFASFEFSFKIKIFVIIFSFIISASFTAIRVPIYLRASTAIEEIMTTEPYIEKNKSILFLTYNKIGVAPDKKEITELNTSDFIKLELFSHSGCYLGLIKPIIILDNIFAVYTHFPYIWRSDKCVFNIIQQANSMNGIYGSPPDVDILSYTPTTNSSIDYIALRNYDSKFADNPRTINLFRELNTMYEEIFTSKSGIIRLFKKITEKELIDNIKNEASMPNILKLCNFYFNNGRYAECIKTSENTISKFPDSKEAWAFCGASYIKIEDITKAKYYLKKSLELCPDFDFAKDKFLFLKKVAEADSIYNISTQPQQLIYISSIFYNYKFYNKCILACRKALKYNPYNADAYNNICSAYNCLGEYNKAADACKKAIEIKPDYELAKNNLKVSEEGIKSTE